MKARRGKAKVDEGFTKVVERLAKADADLQDLTGNSTDAVIDPRTGRVILTQKAQYELRESAARYREIVEKSFGGIVMLDAEGRLKYVNGRMLEMLGRAQDEVMGRAIFEFVSGEAIKRARLQWESRKRGAVGQFELAFCRRDGTSFEAFVSSTPLFGKDGNHFGGSLAVVTDLTEHKRKEEGGPAGAEDGGSRPARRRHRARFQ